MLKDMGYTVSNDWDIPGSVAAFQINNGLTENTAITEELITQLEEAKAAGHKLRR